MNPMNVLAKFEVPIALAVPEITGGSQKIGQTLDKPTLTFLQNFSGLLFGCTLWMFRPNLESVSEIIASGVLGGDCESQSWERRGRTESGMVPFDGSKERWWVPKSPPQ